MSEHEKYAEATIEQMHKVFTVPEAPDSTLARIEQEISSNLGAFLQDHIVAIEKDLGVVEQDFADTRVPEKPMYVSDQTDFLLEKLVAHSVHTSSPSFIGHMTSALPYFMLSLSKIMIALNQNLVKTETSKAFTPLERQVLGMMHRLVYDRDDTFYQRWTHDSRHGLGSMASGGTVANITALWVARNRAFPAGDGFAGVSREGLFKALRHYAYDNAVVLVSRRGHYSLSKAADVLGIGRSQVIPIDTDNNYRIDLAQLEATCARLSSNKTRIIAIVGIAGTTETGNVDPLAAMADIAARYQAHFHVDAAWGGPTLFSGRYRAILKGIEDADSVTIDAHKQLYVPMGAGLVVFKDPAALQSIEHHAQYIIREGSRDLGSTTLEGSRPGMAMLIHSGLRIIGREGYELLINEGIRKAQLFARMIKDHDDFELVSAPELNILTYRYCPAWVSQALSACYSEQRQQINQLLDQINQWLQKTQREHGRAFVSRTRLPAYRHGGTQLTVFRVVLANPLTTPAILEAVLEEQSVLARGTELTALVNELEVLCRGSQS